MQAKENDRRRRARVEFDKLMEKVCRSGFYGSASITVSVQDGHVQITRVAVDRMIRH